MSRLGAARTGIRLPRRAGSRRRLDTVSGLGEQSGMPLFDDFEIFARVAELGNFSRAAEALNLSRSRVSEAVRALETRVGARLFERTTRQVAPTEAGRAFYARVRRAIDEAQAGYDELAARVDEPAGRLRIGAVDDFADRYLVPPLASFLVAYPRLSIELQEDVRQADLVAAGLDLAIRIAVDPDPGLIVRRLGDSRVIVVAAPTYLAAAGAPGHPNDVVRHRLVGFAPVFWGREWRFRGPEGAMTVPVAPALLTHATASLRQAALEGFGLAALPDWAVARELAEGRLVRVLADWATPEAGIYAVYPSNRLIAVRVRACVDHLARHLARALRPAAAP
jgi:DNA-binding transcriptional LysR family regulator